jgi:tetratricopeptide (TPR) repeat protein
MQYLAHLARLLYDPVGAITALRAARPIGPALVTSLLMTVAYRVLVEGLAHDVARILAVGGFDSGGARILFAYVLHLPRYALPVIFLAAIYIPAALLLVGALAKGVGPAEILRRDYVASLSALLSAWSVTLAIWAIPALVFSDPSARLSADVWTALPSVTFLVPATVNLAVVAGVGYGRAIVVVLLSGASLFLLPFAAWATVLLSSPLFLIIAIIVLRGLWREWSVVRDARDRLRQNLEASTLNPADASAHVNLGIIYHEQGDLDRAADHFVRALEIDANEVDAHYRLGRIARERGRLAAAISHFDAVVQTDDAHSNSEVWREIGATYHAAGQHDDARAAFEQFIARRPSDAEGLYKLGLTLEALGHRQEARERMQDVIEAVRTAPVYKYRLERQWLVEAESFLRNQ